MAATQWYAVLLCVQSSPQHPHGSTLFSSAEHTALHSSAAIAIEEHTAPVNSSTSSSVAHDAGELRLPVMGAPQLTTAHWALLTVELVAALLQCSTHIRKWFCPRQRSLCAHPGARLWQRCMHYLTHATALGEADLHTKKLMEAQHPVDGTINLICVAPRLTLNAYGARRSG